MLLKRHPLIAFHFIASRDDVEHGKPDPEIYLLVAHEMGFLPEDCLVIEDSPAGVKAGLTAGMNVVAVGRIEHSVNPRSKKCFAF